MIVLKQPLNISFKMIEIIGIVNGTRIRKLFNNVIDAQEYREILDAQYAKVFWNYV